MVILLFQTSVISFLRKEIILPQDKFDFYLLYPDQEMSFFIRSNNNVVSSWSKQLLKEGSGYFRKLFQWSNDGKPVKQPFLMEEFDSQTLRVVSKILVRGIYPILETEDELKDLREVLDFLAIDYDEKEIRLLTGLDIWFPKDEFITVKRNQNNIIVKSDISVKEHFNYLKYGTEIKERICFDLTTSSLTIFGDSNIIPQKKRAIQMGISGSKWYFTEGWFTYLLFGMMIPYLSPELTLELQNKVYPKIHPYFDLEGKRLFSLKGKIIYVGEAPGVKFHLFNSYYHPSISHLEFYHKDIHGGRIGKVDVHFHSINSMDQFQVKGTKVYDHKMIKFEDEGAVFEVWKYLKTENCLVFTSKQKTIFQEVLNYLNQEPIPKSNEMKTNTSYGGFKLFDEPNGDETIFEGKMKSFTNSR